MPMRFRHKHTIILELDINNVEDKNLEYLVRNFNADILRPPKNTFSPNGSLRAEQTNNTSNRA